jgi:phage baseplate assembly protein V
MSDFDTQENDRRLANLAQMGVVEEVQFDNPPKARVRVGELLTGWLRMGTRRAGDAHESWAYSVGEEVLVISTSGNMAQGVIVCALANGANAAQAAAGTFKTTYPGGEIIEIAGGVVTITAPGNVIVNGDVIANGISLINHVHGGITPGPTDTGKPK